MEIKYGKQVDIGSLSGTSFDLFICAGNHEKRVSTAWHNIEKNAMIRKTIIFCYKEQYVPRGIVGDVMVYHITSASQIFELLTIEIASCPSDEFNLFIDYSCMTKYWYYSIILFLTKRKLSKRRINAYFSYTPSKFSRPLAPKPNSEIAPLPGKYIVPTDRPKALIVCLGYEQSKAAGIIEHLDPKIAYIFYTKPALDSRFVSALEKNNHEIISLRSSTVVTYQFDDLLELERKLTEVYFLLRESYSVIIAPLGPKPFTFIAMMVSVRYSDVDIWRVGSGSDINEYKREPIENQFIVSQIVLE